MHSGLTNGPVGRLVDNIEELSFKFLGHYFKAIKFIILHDHAE